MLRLIVALVAALLTVGGAAMVLTLAATGDGDTDTTVRTETVTRTMGGSSSDEVTRAAAAEPLPCSAEDTAKGRIVSNHEPPRLRLIRYCGRGHATVRFRGKTYELLSGHCGRPMKSRSPRRGTESLRHILFGLHGARRPSAEGELWLVPRPGNRPGRVTIDDGEISAGGVRMLPHFGGGTAFVEAGLTSGTFRSMATLMNLFQTGTVQKRELVTGSWDCG